MNDIKLKPAKFKKILVLLYLIPFLSLADDSEMQITPTKVEKYQYIAKINVKESLENFLTNSAKMGYVKEFDKKDVADLLDEVSKAKIESLVILIDVYIDKKGLIVWVDEDPKVLGTPIKQDSSRIFIEPIKIKFIPIIKDSRKELSLILKATTVSSFKPNALKEDQFTSAKWEYVDDFKISVSE